MLREETLRLTLGYEFRRLQSRFHRRDISFLLERDRRDHNWHVFSVGVNVTEGVQVIGFLGGMETLGLQVKFDF